MQDIDSKQPPSAVDEKLVDEIVDRVASRLKLIIGAVWIAIVLMALVGIPYVVMPPLKSLLFGGEHDLSRWLAKLPLTSFARLAILVLLCSYLGAAIVRGVGWVAGFIPSFGRPVPLSTINGLSTEERETLAVYLQNAAQDIGGTLGPFAKASLQISNFTYKISLFPVFAALLVLSSAYAWFAGWSV